MSAKVRESGLELYRIIFMLLIVAHHYVVHSGFLQCLKRGSDMGINDAFLWVFGGWGKIGIACFVLITGYFMCTSSISLRRFLKTLIWALFYHYSIGMIFFITGYNCLTLKSVISYLLPFCYVTNSFTASFLVFYLFIPFLNKVIVSLGKRLHGWLLVLLLGVYSVLPSMLYFQVSVDYIQLFCVLYLISSYIRLYTVSVGEKTKFAGGGRRTLLLAIICIVSILGSAFGSFLWPYFFVADFNKVLALLFSVSAFLWFKNLKIKSQIINAISSSTFGVLCIHDNSDAMRKWLWRDVCNNVSWIDSSYCILHAIGCVILIFTICTVIDRFVYKRLFEKTLLDASEKICLNVWNQISALLKL